MAPFLEWLGSKRMVQLATIAMFLVVTTASLHQIQVWLFPSWGYYQRIHNYLEKQVYAPGEPLLLRVNVSRYVPRGCLLEIDRFVMTAADREILWSQIVPGIAQEGDDQMFRRKIQIPVLPAGDYILRSEARNYCAGYTHSDSAELRFTVK